MAKVPNLVVVLLCILGGGAVVTVLAAFGKSMFGKDHQETDFNQRSPEQESYLQRVREINRLAIWGTAKSQRREDRRQREMEASDIEIGSGMGYSNGGGYAGHSQQGGGYHGQGYGNASTEYYEEGYGGHENTHAIYDDQRRHSGTSRGNPYVSGHGKSAATETWNEVPR